jgi:ferredoxin
LAEATETETTRLGGREHEVRVGIDLTRCAGYGNCIEAAPEVFDMADDEDVAIVLTENPGPEHAEAVRKAARVCPADAVLIEE